MEPDHQRWITAPATLDHWTISARPDPTDDCPARWAIQVTAHCARRPRPLYTYVEHVDTTDPNQVTDVVHHLALVLYQDEPAKSEYLVNGLMGQQRLPY